MSKILVANIDWDTDGYEVDLPEEVVIKKPTKEMLEDIKEGGYAEDVCEYLSDEYGYCVVGFTAEIIGG